MKMHALREYPGGRVELAGAGEDLGAIDNGGGFAEVAPDYFGPDTSWNMDGTSTTSSPVLGQAVLLKQHCRLMLWSEERQQAVLNSNVRQ